MSDNNTIEIIQLPTVYNACDGDFIRKDKKEITLDLKWYGERLLEIPDEKELFEKLRSIANQLDYDVVNFQVKIKEQA